jgi:hypothetical protein
MLFVLGGVSPQVAAGEDPWESHRFLEGEWEGEGSGKPGEGKGQFSFAFELQGKVLVRKNHSAYPATAGRPAIKHDDLMVVYRADGGKQIKAIYFDSEDHVINYTATVSEDKRTVTYVSDMVPAAPCYRLSYTKGKDAAVSIKFEIAPPDKPSAFKTYLEGTARRLDRAKSGPSKHKD